MSQIEKTNPQVSQKVRNAYLALAAICLIWGTTYTVIKIGVQYLPPFFLAASRQTFAGIFLVLLALVSKKFVPVKPFFILIQAIIGFAMLTGGNGLMTWGLQYIPSGLSSVISALTPVVVLLISYLWKGGERMTWPIFWGILLGFVGMAIIFNDGWAALVNEDYRLGIFAAFGSLLTWSFGVVMAKRYSRDEIPPIQSAGMQIFFGGIGLYLCSFVFEKNIPIQHDWRGYASLLYLTIFGSAIAFSLYMYVLKHLSATLSSLYAYINPIVAIVLGSLFLGEKLTFIEISGMSLTLIGVYVANSAYISQKIKDSGKARKLKVKT